VARALSLALALAAVIGLVSTVVMGVPHSLRVLNGEHDRFEPLGQVEREQAFGTHVPARMDIFDFYRRSIRRDDLFYVQVPKAAFGAFADQATVVRSIARYYLAPAVEVERLAEATVVISYEADPGLLPVEYSEQIRAGLQLIFVSRVAR
jgi:hypothetical protein